MSVTTRSFRNLALVTASVALFSQVSNLAQAAERRPVAAVTIYPGDIIRDQMLRDVDYPDAAASSFFATSHSMIVGKVARHTLLPGNPIPTNAVSEPKLVTVGAMVRLVFEEDGLQIATYATALQAGASGDFVSVRNRETGVTVGGTVQPDGSIHVGPG